MSEVITSAGGASFIGDSEEMYKIVVRALETNKHPVYAFAEILGQEREPDWPWGSVQYESSETVYHALKKLKEMEVKDPIASLTMRKIKTSDIIQMPPREIDEETMGQWVENQIAENEDIEGESLDDKVKDAWLALRTATTLDPVLITMRYQSSTLWSAALRALDIVFPGSAARLAKNVLRLLPPSQYDNASLRTGIACFLLMDRGLVTNPILFTDFDT